MRGSLSPGLLQPLLAQGRAPGWPGRLRVLGPSVGVLGHLELFMTNMENIFPNGRAIADHKFRALKLRFFILAKSMQTPIARYKPNKPQSQFCDLFFKTSFFQGPSPFLKGLCPSQAQRLFE